MTLLNLTPHTINYMSVNNEVIALPASGTVARLPMRSQPILVPGADFTCTTVVYGEVEGVPAVGEGPFVVSAMVLGKLGVEYRGQAFAPDTGPSAVREAGLIKYVTGFITV